MNDHFDVAIVGAGPAGSTAAKLLGDRGWHVALIDKAKFPRHKTCASWINRLAFEDFPYLLSRLEDLVDIPFYGIRFFNHDFTCHNTASERKPSGYLTLRSKFDNGLKDIAIGAGAKFFEEHALAALEQNEACVSLTTSKSVRINAKILIGADGTNSRVAEMAHIRKAWQPQQICSCANEDIPYDAAAIKNFYGERFPVQAMLQFEDINGYGWLFPKKDHICIGVGARLRESENIRKLYTDFLDALKRKRLVPSDLTSQRVYYAVDPAGAVNHGHSLVRGRVMLIGDAAGFVSGTTGEGIYPAMLSARVAAEVIAEALRDKNPQEHLALFEPRWRQLFGSYIKNLPGGERRASTLRRIDWIFKSRFVCRVAANLFLYGRNLDFKTAWESLWI